MLKFFRSIRRKLLDQGSLRKYLVYAIGEILLVMVGILLALQVNNWNEKRKNRIEEQVILENLQTDFQDNLSQLQKKIVMTKKSQEAIEKVVSTFINKDLDKGAYAGVDTLLQLISRRTSFDAKTSSLDQVFSTGKLGVIRNQALRNMLSAWSSNLQEVTEVEARTRETRQRYDNYLADKFPIADMYANNPTEHRRIGFSSNFKVDESKIFKDLEFENIISSKSFGQVVLLERYFLVEQEIQKILKLIESEKK